MSRRPPADRAAQNAQTLKALVKLEGNKVCADCKRNKHPRWASWNLGVFVCIRCSGIHRGMGTHISRVKSVDLDAWTDEQLQNILKWGNTRANKYWEAKLAPGHSPSEAKIENFIRTKYESKRWVMDGPMPDPSTLDADGDDNMPLNIVQEKAKIERSASQRQAPAQPQAQSRPAANVNLFDDFTPPPPVRPSTADIVGTRPTRTAPPAPTPASRPAGKPQDSLLSLDFFGSTSAAGMGRPSSAASNPLQSTNTRGDLKSSILSLYASAPKPQPAQQPQHNREPSFGAMAAPSAPKQDAFGGLADAFGGLSFPSTTTAKSPPPPAQTSSNFSAFGSLTSSQPPKAAPSAPQITSPPPLSGGGFFDSLPSKPPAPKPSVMSPAASNGLDFAFTQQPATQTPAAAPKPAGASIPVDLFAADDFGGFASSTPASPPKPAPATVSSPPASTANLTSAFNLSSPTVSAPKPAPQPAAQAFKTSANPQGNAATFDPWGSSNDSPWGAPEPAPAKPAPPTVDLGKPPTHITPNDISGGWGEPISSSSKPAQQPTVTADEDFGGWTSASTTQTPVAPPAKSGGSGFGAASDPFDNPWG
ncbi:hypothetical protein EDD36DRAFT_441527 [Exophiala viscosa]|uniref:Arf-GAP domain-containing protein n=1 Tax=Exophiala viscosa TaxID=2486360 RepID=A0AAN6DU90_9EURO|nr:hypothetical protein EDD36DRAFT_441527 [Exophiala viscosa]